MSKDSEKDDKHSLEVVKLAITQAAIMRTEFAMLPVKHLKAVLELAQQYVDLKE